jgi:hypothetical protein
MWVLATRRLVSARGGFIYLCPSSSRALACVRATERAWLHTERAWLHLATMSRLGEAIGGVHLMESELLLLRSRCVPALGQRAREQLRAIDKELARVRGSSASELGLGRNAAVPANVNPQSAPDLDPPCLPGPSDPKRHVHIKPVVAPVAIETAATQPRMRRTNPALVREQVQAALRTVYRGQARNLDFQIASSPVRAVASSPDLSRANHRPVSAPMPKMAEGPWLEPPVMLFMGRAARREQDDEEHLDWRQKRALRRRQKEQRQRQLLAETGDDGNDAAFAVVHDLAVRSAWSAYTRMGERSSVSRTMLPQFQAKPLKRAVNGGTLGDVPPPPRPVRHHGRLVATWELPQNHARVRGADVVVRPRPGSTKEARSKHSMA